MYMFAMGQEIKIILFQNKKKCSKGSKGNKQDYNTGVGKNEKEDKNLLSFSAVLGGDI